MANLMALGLISFFIGVVGYVSWTRPNRPEPPTGYTLGSIRGAQFAMGLGILLFAIGLLGTIVEWLT